MRITSNLHIRKQYPNMGVLELPYGSIFNIFRFSESIQTIPNTFRATQFDGFVKERGECADNEFIFHFEMISAIVNKRKIPIIFKIWNFDMISFYGREFVIWNGLRYFRENILNTKVSTNILSVIFSEVGTHYPGDLIDPFNMVISGCYFDRQHLIPNMTSSEYNSLINSLPLHLFSATEVIDFFIRNVFHQSIMTDTVIALIGLVDGAIPRYSSVIVNDDESNTLDHYHTHMTMSSREQEAFLLLGRIPYDGFDIDIDLTTSQFKVNTIHSSAGANFPFNYQKISNYISILLDKFVQLYFLPKNEGEIIRYFDDNYHEIKSVNILKTNSELVAVHCNDGMSIYTKQYDTLLLSIMTPIIA